MTKQIYPYIIYFIVKPTPTASYEEIYKQELTETNEYYLKFGKDGFLSEKMYLEDIEDIAKRNATRKYKINQNHVSVIEKLYVDTPENEPNIISLVENRKDFLRWISDRPIEWKGREKQCK